MNEARGSWLKRLVRHSVFQNALALYGVQASNFVLPLIALPYVARVLRPEAWGAVLFAQSLSIWLMIVVEYGFIFSATRDLARHRDDENAVADIAAGVLSAKLILVCLVSLICLVVIGFVSQFQRHPELLLWAWAWAIGQGMSSLWYFQGIEKIRFAAILEMIGRLLSVAAIFVFVKSPTDAPVVIAWQAITSLASSAALFWIMYRRVSFRVPSLSGAVNMLRAGFSMFFYRLCVSFYTSANALILGVMTNSVQVGYYGSAEKIVTAANGVYWPFWRATFPRISYNLERNRAEAVRLARLSFVLVLGYGLFITLLIVLLAPVVVPWLLGEEYKSMIPTLQNLALIIPFVGVSGSLGLQWMVPNGFERELNFITLFTALANIASSILLVKSFEANGMAISVLISEFFAVILSVIYLGKVKKLLN
jgi:polysaccharide transporter, PST family